MRLFLFASTRDEAVAFLENHFSVDGCVVTDIIESETPNGKNYMFQLDIDSVREWEK